MATVPAPVLHVDADPIDGLERGTVHVLAEDPALLGDIDAQFAASAHRQLIARSLFVDSGPWEPLDGDCCVLKS